MGIEDRIFFNLDGKATEVKLSNLASFLPVDALFTGSIMYDEESHHASYYFSNVNSEELCYVLNKAKQNANEVQIEVRSHAKDTEGIQPESFEKPNL